MMNKPFNTLVMPEQILASHLNYGDQGITIVCGVRCNCKNHLSETSKLKLGLWVRFLNRLKNPLYRSLASRLQDWALQAIDNRSLLKIAGGFWTC